MSANHNPCSTAIVFQQPARLYRAGDKARQSKANPGVNESYRSPYRRDFGRLLHSPAFRRLQGKTQLFPGHESDFFRNRLTHSFEVAQIAKSIANKLNSEHQYFSVHKIDTDLVEFAALAHDLGHPPFGHNGEEALDECMADAGGFEGNAQTLRILTRLEKRATMTGGASNLERILDGADNRAGLNLTFRSLASVLKYDNVIPRQKRDRKEMGPIKGYYYTEQIIVDAIRAKVGSITGKPFRTIECSIMDIADDIAYSTYDLEDAFKAKFLDPSFFNCDRRKYSTVCLQNDRTESEALLPRFEAPRSVFQSEGLLSDAPNDLCRSV